MECNQWNENGLLFTSGELDDILKNEFSNHLNSCSMCRCEFDTYESEKKVLYNPIHFEETPSESINKEILRVCCKPRNYSFFPIGFQSVFKNTFFAFFVLAIGFGGGVYFAGLNKDSESNQPSNTMVNKVAPAAQQIGVISPPALMAKQHITHLVVDDSLNSDSAVQTIKKGNISMEGVHSVNGN